MQTIYDFFINTGKSWGIWTFLQNIGNWGDFFLFIAVGLILAVLSIVMIRLFLKIPNTATRIILSVLLLLIIAFGFYVYVNLCVQTISAYGALV